MHNVVYPTHKCFDDALDFIAERLKAASLAELLDDVEKLLLVHAICCAPDGTPYSHAWVEDGNFCIDRGIFNNEYTYFAVEKEEFYLAKCVQECTKYSLKEACELNMRHNSYGPWEERYKILLKVRNE